MKGVRSRLRRDVVFRDVISDETWAVIGLLSSTVKAAGRPPVDRRTVAEATAWRFPDGFHVRQAAGLLSSGAALNGAPLQCARFES